MITRRQRIRHPSQLSSLTVWRLIPPLVPNHVEIEAERVSAETVQSWEKDIDALQHACGCKEGAIGMIFGVSIYSIFLLTQSGGWSEAGRREFWIGLTVVVVASSVGKLIGLWNAQRKLDRIIKTIESQWAPSAWLGPHSESSGTAPVLRRSTHRHCCS